MLIGATPREASMEVFFTISPPLGADRNIQEAVETVALVELSCAV